MSPRILAPLCALPFLLAPAAAQAAPTVSELKDCYVTALLTTGPASESVEFTATGFTPNSLVDLTVDDQPVDGGTGLQTDATGSLPVSVPAPFIEAGFRDFTITLTEQGNPVNAISVTAKTSALGVSVKPRSAPPSNKVRFKGLGFTADKSIWAHYIYKGKVRKTVKMEDDPGTCGRFRARRRQIPVKNPGTGSWIIQFDQSKRYRGTRVPGVFVRMRIVVTLVPVG
jgi:hypothetical protein